MRWEWYIPICSQRNRPIIDSSLWPEWGSRKENPRPTISGEYKKPFPHSLSSLPYPQEFVSLGRAQALSNGDFVSFLCHLRSIFPPSELSLSVSRFVICCKFCLLRSKYAATVEITACPYFESWNAPLHIIWRLSLIFYMGQLIVFFPPWFACLSCFRIC